LDRCKIWASSLEFISEYFYCWKLWKNVGGDRNSFRIVTFFLSCRNSKYVLMKLRSGLVNRWIVVKFGHQVDNSFPHIFIVGICKIISGEGEILIARKVEWKFQSLLLLSNVWKPYQSNQRKSLRNVRELLEMSLLLLEDTWARLEVRDEFIAIEVRMDICRNL